MERQLRVMFTRHPGTHSAYRELAASPPGRVTYLWPEPSNGARVAYTHSRLGSIGLRALHLPNLRPFLGGLPNIDVVHSQQALLLTTRPWVVDVEHAMPFVGIDFDRYEHQLTRLLIRQILAARSCRAILPWTETAAGGFLETFGDNESIRRKTRVVAPAIRASSAAPQRNSGPCCNLLFVANQPEHNFALKGGRELLLAFQHLRPRHPEVRLTIVGAAPGTAGALASQPGVHWTGVVDRGRLDDLYTRADIFVMPSFSDTFGMVFLEAMAFGLPIVALDRPYTREIVSDGETGELVPLGETSIRWCRPDGRFDMNSDVFIDRLTRSEPDPAVTEGVVRVLERLIERPAYRQQLGERAREEASTGRFSVSTRNAALAQIYAAAIR